MNESAPTTESSQSVLTDAPPAQAVPDQAVPSGIPSILDGSFGGTEETVRTFDPQTLSEDLRNEPSLQSFDSVDNLAKSYVHARRMIGTDPSEVLRVPKEGDADGWNQIYNRLGRPDEPSGYQFDLGDGEEDSNVADFKNVAHQLGLSNNQAKMVLGIYNQVNEQEITKDQEEFEQMNVEQLQQIQTEWGDSFKRNSELARRAIQNFASEETVEALKEVGLINHPEILKTFSRIGEAMAESDFLPGTRGQTGAPSPANAEDQISQRMQDQDFKLAYLDENNPGHDGAVREMTKLFSFATP